MGDSGLPFCFLALLVEFSSDGGFSPPNPSMFSGIRLFFLIYQKIAVLCWTCADTDEASFLYIMGYSSEMNGNIKKIVWLKSKQLARECFLLRNEKAINSKQLKISTMEKMITQLFLYKGKPLELSKNRMEYSNESDILEKIFRPNPTL